MLIVIACILQESKHLTVSAVKNLKMNDDVVVVAVSPEGKHIAVALLDTTIKVSSCFSQFKAHWYLLICFYMLLNIISLMELIDN